MRSVTLLHDWRKFDPRQDPETAESLYAWYTAKDVASLGVAGGSAQASWADLSGNAHTLTGQGSPAPAYTENAYQGSPAITIVGSNSNLYKSISGTWASYNSVSFVFFGRCTDTTTNRKVIISGRPFGGNGLTWTWETSNNVQRTYHNTDLATWSVPTGWHIWWFRQSDAQNIYTSGYENTTARVGTGTKAPPTSTWAIGAEDFNVDDSRLTGDISEFLIFGHTSEKGYLSDSTLTRVVNYLNAKYGHD